MNTVKLFELVELVQLQRKDTKYCKSISPAGLAATGMLQVKKTIIRKQTTKWETADYSSHVLSLPTPHQHLLKMFQKSPFSPAFWERPVQAGLDVSQQTRSFQLRRISILVHGWTGTDRFWWALCLIAQIILKITINITKRKSIFF